MKEFTRKKFLSLPVEKQHKTCAKLLNVIYNALLTNKPWQNWVPTLNTYEHWLGMHNLESIELQAVADRYHAHLKKAQSDGPLLPPVSHFDRTESEKPWPIGVYLDQLRSAHNVGSILRTVEGFGLGTVYFSKDTPWIDQKKVQEASRDTHLSLKCARTENPEHLPKPLIALETADSALPLHRFAFPHEFTLAVGNEEYGCSSNTLAAADFIVQIPLRGRKNSLNVANAFAATASEICRQRKTHDGQ